MAQNEADLQSFTFQRAVLAAGAVLMLAKFAAWTITGSNAILSDALESIVNILAGAVSLLALWVAAQPNDRNHPYGHGKIEFISAGIEGALISVAGLAAMGKGAYNLVYPQPVGHLDIGVALTGAAGAVNYFMGWMARRKGRVNHSMALDAAGRHLQSDAYSTVGLLVGLGLVMYSGKVWIDNAIAILFGIIILFTGAGVIRRSLSALMDESDFSLVEEVLAAVKRHRAAEWIDLHNLRVMRVGSAIHIDCHLTLPWYLELREAHRHIHLLEDELRREFSGHRLECFVHADACVPASCALCTVQHCAHRTTPFVQRVEWTVEQVMGTEKHRI